MIQVVRTGFAETGKGFLCRILVIFEYIKGLECILAIGESYMH